MKIMLIVPAADCRRNFIYRLGNYVYGPGNAITGPLILGGILKRAGHDVEVYQELDKDFDPGLMARFDLVGFYTMTSNSGRAYELADIARNVMGKRVIIGGIHASTLPDEASLHADQVIKGEAENVILDVVEGRIKDTIVYAEPVNDLDSLPFPDYSVLKTPCKAANIMTTRGCPYACSFCTTSKMFAPYRERSIENVLEEIRMYKRMGFKYINFQDDNLTANKRRIKTLLKRMISENLVFRESFFFGRIDLARDDELLELLRDARLRRVLIGFESLNQETHDMINKKLNVEDIHSLAHKLSAYKIKVIAGFVIGLDTDTQEDINKAVDFCKRINAYQLQSTVLTPYPGTDVYRQLAGENRIFENDWKYYDMMNVVYLPKHFTPAELQAQFFISMHRLYSLRSLYRIFRLFGPVAFLRRIGLWLTFSLALIYYRIMERFVPGSLYFSQHSYEKHAVNTVEEVPVTD